MKAILFVLLASIAITCYAQTPNTANLAFCYSLSGQQQDVGAVLQDQCRTCVCTCIEYTQGASSNTKICVRAQWANCTQTGGTAGCNTPPAFSCFDQIASQVRLPNETWARDTCTKCQCLYDARSQSSFINCTRIPDQDLCPTTKPDLCYRRLPSGALDQGWQIGSQYVEDCRICRCEQPDPRYPAAWQCVYSPTAGDCPTQPATPKCLLNGVSYNLGDVLSLPCQRCVCVQQAFSNTANFSCSPIDATSSTAVGNGCAPAPVRCAVGTVVYAQGQQWQDATGCRNCSCNVGAAGQGVVECIPSGTCGTIPPVTQDTCSIGDTILKVGEQVSFGCRVCTCSYVCNGPATASNTACSVQLSCVLNATNPNCVPPTKCVDTNNNTYTVGQLWWKDRCTACYCDTNGWICRPITTPPCSSTPSTPPTCKAIDGTIYQVNDTVRFSQCEVCTCVATTTATSGLAGAAWVCERIPNCNPTTQPPATTAAPTGTSTALPTTPRPTGNPDPETQFCYDKEGRRYLVGTVAPSADGCSYCKCGYEYTNGTVSRLPTWICNPTYAQTNSRCCNVSGVIIRPGSFAIDRAACKNCSCGPNGVTCTPLSFCSMCEFEGVKYAQGEVRKNPNGCGFCRCALNANNQPSWECSTEPCDRKCVRLNVTVTLSGADAHYDKDEIIKILDSIFGNGNYRVYIASAPDNTTIYITVICLDGVGAATDVQGRVEQAILKAFSREGQNSDASVSSNIEDAGNVDATSSTSGAVTTIVSTTLSCIVLLIAAMLF